MSSIINEKQLIGSLSSPCRTQGGSGRVSGEAGRARDHHLEAQSSAIQEHRAEGAGMGTSRASIRDFE